MKNNGNDACNQSVTHKRTKELLEYKGAVRMGKADYKQVGREQKVCKRKS